MTGHVVVDQTLYTEEIKAQRESMANAAALVGARCRMLEAENAALKKELETLKAKDGAQGS